MKGPKPTQDKTIPIGSTIRVVDEGQNYSTYDTMAGFMGLNKWKLGNRTEEGKEYTVVSKAVHPVDGECLGVRSSTGVDYIIGVEGVELVNPLKGLSGQVAALELQLQEALAEVETLKALVENIKNLVK